VYVLVGVCVCVFVFGTDEHGFARGVDFNHEQENSNSIVFGFGSRAKAFVHQQRRDLTRKSEGKVRQGRVKG